MDAAMTDGGLETVAAEKSEILSREENDKNPEIQTLAANGATTAAPSEALPRGVKRPAEGEPDESDDGGDSDAADHGDGVQITTDSTKPQTKNQLKKMRRRQKWEEGKAERAEKRRDKRRTRQERKKLENEAEVEQAKKEGRNPVLKKRERERNPQKQTKVPVSIILDCNYEQYMMDNEMVSLANQVTRCYSDNRTAEYPVHLAISSYGGALKQRHETVLHNHHLKWRDVRFVEEDFVGAAQQAKQIMAGPEGGKLVDLLKGDEGKDFVSWEEPHTTASQARRKSGAEPEPEPEPEDVDKSIVYLTADSPYTLDRIEPNTSYVVGGIIDRNRHKGLCYKVARDRKVRTAKLPIGEFMVLLDRHVLATNHVVEIMLRWLETGDWGEAFMKVIPPRKGGSSEECRGRGNSFRGWNQG
ncbi:tRNA (guanine(9)-N1)-methyltransferase [Apiospora rasikravindrae]|uniref:tRNA (guanine(9)-N1)-methyltransferase n=1 Tax=Apiospora rasikravindrae TaxID=990691 RepID=A0ABR1UB98_9PEZI